eukprot:104954_1
MLYEFSINLILMTTITDNKKKRMHIGIIGGGLSAIATAAALLDISPNINMDVFESHLSMHTSGYVLGLGPQGIKAIDDIGLLTDNMKQTLCIQYAQNNISFSDYNGNVIRRQIIDYTHINKYYVTNQILRKTLLKTLMQETAQKDTKNKITIHYNHKATNITYNQMNNKMNVQFNNKDIKSFDFIIGCDGIHSIVRKCCIENDYKSNKLIRIHKDNLIIFWNKLDITNKENENITGYKWFIHNVINQKAVVPIMSTKCTILLQYCHYNRIVTTSIICSKYMCDKYNANNKMIYENNSKYHNIKHFNKQLLKQFSMDMIQTVNIEFIHYLFNTTKCFDENNNTIISKKPYWVRYNVTRNQNITDTSLICPDSHRIKTVITTMPYPILSKNHYKINITDNDLNELKNLEQCIMNLKLTFDNIIKSHQQPTTKTRIKPPLKHNTYKSRKYDSSAIINNNNILISDITTTTKSHSNTSPPTRPLTQYDNKPRHRTQNKLKIISNKQKQKSDDKSSPEEQTNPDESKSSGSVETISF